MYIFGIIVLIVILIIGRVDYVKTDKELRRCPKCNNIIKRKFDLKSDDKSFSIPGQNGEKSGVTIYNCQRCGNSWNHTYELSENNT